MNNDQTEAERSQSNIPDISIIVTIVSGATHLAACLNALAQQEDCSKIITEVLVPFNQDDLKIKALVAEFPSIAFHPMPLSVKGPTGLCHEHFDELRAAGLRLSKGNIVAILEDHEIPADNWCKKMVDAHNQLDHAGIGGAVENDIDKAINWATYFFDFGRYQNPLPEGPSPFLTDVNVAYKRRAVEKTKKIWENGFHEPAVHGELLSTGESLWLAPDIIVYQHRSDLSLPYVLKERFVWGRYFSGNRIKSASLVKRIAFCAASLAVPAIILTKRFRDVLSKKRHVDTFVKALPTTLVLILFWSIGEFVGYFTGRASTFD